MRGREISNVWLPLMHPLLGPTTQACALTGNQTSNPLVLRLVLNPLGAHQLRLFLLFKMWLLEYLDLRMWFSLCFRWIVLAE